MSSGGEEISQSAPARPQTPAAPGSSATSEGPRRTGLGLAQRVRAARVPGLALGFVAVASVLYQNGAHALVWAALVANAFVWPHVAFVLASRSAQPYRAEVRNLIVDSALGGAWIALMAFNLLPSVLLATVLSMDKLSVGGGRLLARGTDIDRQRDDGLRCVFRVPAMLTAKMQQARVGGQRSQQVRHARIAHLADHHPGGPCRVGRRLPDTMHGQAL